MTDIESTQQASSQPRALVARRWPTLAGLGFAALIAFDLTSGVDLAPVLAASAAVYLGAAALQRPASSDTPRGTPGTTAPVGSWSVHSPSSASPWTPLWRWLS